jgi:hypothetical protein
MRVGRGLVGEMERLRVVSAGEIDRLLARHLVSAVARGIADGDVFPIAHDEGFALKPITRNPRQRSASAPATGASVPSLPATCGRPISVRSSG